MPPKRRKTSAKGKKAKQTKKATTTNPYVRTKKSILTHANVACIYKYYSHWFFLFFFLLFLPVSVVSLVCASIHIFPLSWA